jgi:hypothetical protein
MKNSRFLFLLTGVLFISGIILMNSCKKPEEPRAVVYVIDENDLPVPGALVRVHLSSQDSAIGTLVPGDDVKNDYKVTDASGKTTHQFPEEAIYFVEVTKDADGYDYPVDLHGTGVIILEEDATYEETVKVRPIIE